jgi:hypothetical protein
MLLSWNGLARQPPGVQIQLGSWQGTSARADAIDLNVRVGKSDARYPQKKGIKRPLDCGSPAETKEPFAVSKPWAEAVARPQWVEEVEDGAGGPFSSSKSHHFSLEVHMMALGLVALASGHANVASRCLPMHGSQVSGVT